MTFKAVGVLTSVTTVQYQTTAGALDRSMSQWSANETCISDNFQVNSLLAVRVSAGKTISEIIS